MPVRVVATPYGRAAAEALRAEIARAKERSPLAPVTVIVPGNSVGVAARRLLASGELGAVSKAGPGVIGVAFRTGFQLAELLAAPRLVAAGRRPVSTAVVAAAIRRVLATNPGALFASVATHPATEEALVGAHRELSDLDPESLALLATQSRRAHEVVRIHRLVKEQLAPAWFDEHDLMREAAAVVADGARLVTELGLVVVHLPQRVSTPLTRLLVALAERDELTVIAGLTGVPKADAEVVAGVTRIGGRFDPAAPAVSPPQGTAVCSTSDADDEVRAVVRGIVDAMRAGVPLERMAVVVGNSEPYARLLHDHLTLAGVAHNGVSVRTLADSVLGRGLLRLLALRDHDFRRDDVFAFVAGVPALDGHGHEVPAMHWERISRNAGVVRGLADWDARLTHYAENLTGRDDAWLERERRRTYTLRDYVGELARELDAAPDSWSKLARWTHGLVARWIGSEATRAGWSSDFEQEAARRVDAAIDRLGGLDAVEDAPTLEVFRRSLALELDAARDRVGRLGEGVLVGSAALALGVELERLWVCGLAEGVFPTPPADDPLLADTDRQALAGELPLRRERINSDHRTLLAAFASTSGERTLGFPRGDLRRNTEHVPSRFLLDSVEVLTGRRAFDAETEREPWFTFVPSYVSGLARAGFPATRHELDVRSALSGDPRIAAVPEVARGLELVQARRSSAFTRFDGDVSRLADLLAARSPANADVVVSATRLENWVKCPHAYFAHYLLHLDAIELPEELIQLTPIDKGNIVHATLEQFLIELRDQPGVGRPWTDAQRGRLCEILTDRCDELEARGLSGKRLLWARARREMRAQLDAFLDFDAGYRTARGADTLATEFAFGRGDSHPAVEIPLSDGRTVRVIGSIDRVDRFGDGRLAVIDYKTGSSTSYTKVSHDAPLQNGQLLQLPIYARAARTYLGDGSTEPVLAEYWFVLRDPTKPRGYEVDAEVDDALDDALRVIVSGIDAGHFPARPEQPGFSRFIPCEFCDPDGLGTTDTHRAWLRKQSVPELADYVALIGAES